MLEGKIAYFSYKMQEPIISFHAICSTKVKKRKKKKKKQKEKKNKVQHHLLLRFGY
jgi:predicted RNase H-like nuclease